MNVPAIAKKSFDELYKNNEFISIVNLILSRLKKISGSYLRAKFIHDVVDEYNQEIFAHPLVKQLSPCKVGCTGCCHTQVSVTDDEARLLVRRIREGVEIDFGRLRLQAKAENDSVAFFKINYQDRRCVFLSDQGVCRVYNDRPSVCRTNAVLGSAQQCDTSEGLKPIRLIRTPKADMVIYASFLDAKSGGSLAYMLEKNLK